MQSELLLCISHTVGFEGGPDLIDGLSLFKSVCTRLNYDISSQLGLLELESLPALLVTFTANPLFTLESKDD